MVASYSLMGLMNFIILIVVCYCWIDPTVYANSATGFPFLALFETATGSASGAVALVGVIVLLVVASAMNTMASTSRQVFAFARDGGLPFQRWLAKTNPRTLTPMNSLILVFSSVWLLSLIGLGSTV
jgi:choline transport protein